MKENPVSYKSVRLLKYSTRFAFKSHNFTLKPRFGSQSVCEKSRSHAIQLCTMYTESLFLIISFEWLDFQILFVRILPSYRKLPAQVFPCRRTEEPRYLPCMFMINSLSSVLQFICWSKKSLSNWRALQCLTQVWVSDSLCLSCISRVYSTRVQKMGFSLVCEGCFKLMYCKLDSKSGNWPYKMWMCGQCEMHPVFFVSEST